jgi:hypothetical protein
MGRDDDREWAELVESFHASPDATPDDEARRWPAAEDVNPDLADGNDKPSVTLGGVGELPDASAYAGLMPAGHGPEPELEPPSDSGADDENANHFVPPPPPPIPRGDRFLRSAWWGALGSPALFIVIVLFQWTPADWVMVGIVGTFIVSFMALMSRLRGHHPDDPDNGAVV